MFLTAVLTEQASNIFDALVRLFDISYPVHSKKVFTNTKFFYCCSSTRISCKTSKCIGFSSVIGYFLYFFRINISPFIPSIALNYML